MQIDWQTLQDLGILHPQGNQLSLFEWANSTRTAGGAQRLKERFRQPLSNIDDIRDTQAAVAWLMRNEELFDPLLGGSAWHSIERYIESRVVALDYPNRLFRWLDSWWVRYIRSNLYREVLAALSLVQTLVLYAARIEEDLSRGSLPPALDGWRDQLRACLGSKALHPIRAARSVHRLRPPAVLALDGELRRMEFQPLRQFADLIYEIDSLRSLATTTRKYRLALPTFLEDGAPRVEAEHLVHPLLDQPVGNALAITPSERLLFLTGPNMAGKSTYLKSAGVAVHLAHVGMGVPARVFNLTLFDCLFSGINTTDNLRLGQSYFYREVRRVRELTEALETGGSTFAIFDEMFKGTNLKDASDACVTVLTGLSACQGSVFIVASHIAELATAVGTLPGAAFRKFGARVADGEASFDYLLSEGVSNQRLGMHVLEAEGVLARLGALSAANPVSDANLEVTGEPGMISDPPSTRT